MTSLMCARPKCDNESFAIVAFLKKALCRKHYKELGDFNSKGRIQQSSNINQKEQTKVDILDDAKGTSMPNKCKCGHDEEAHEFDGRTLTKSCQRGCVCTDYESEFAIKQSVEIEMPVLSVDSPTINTKTPSEPKICRNCLSTKTSVTCGKERWHKYEGETVCYKCYGKLRREAVKKAQK